MFYQPFPSVRTFGCVGWCMKLDMVSEPVFFFIKMSMCFHYTREPSAGLVARASSSDFWLHWLVHEA